ncbi:MAG: hypothetical protein ACD_11C00018G0036 [uncultured bacterium]|nr:MAG: hypothetical protein ACD_11C00018G0036 [uncultured bacterium]
MKKNTGLLIQACIFLKEKRAWWMVPIIIMIFFVGALVIFAQSSAISPFIYSLF